MDSSNSEDSSSQTDCECLKDGEVDSWDAREQEVFRSQQSRLPLWSIVGKNSWQNTSSLRWKCSQS